MADCYCKAVFQHRCMRAFLFQPLSFCLPNTQTPKPYSHIEMSESYRDDSMMVTHTVSAWKLYILHKEDKNRGEGRLMSCGLPHRFRKPLPTAQGKEAIAAQMTFY